MSSSDMRPSEKLTPGVRTSEESISTPWAWAADAREGSGRNVRDWRAR